MSVRLGIEVGTIMVRAVLVRRGKPVWVAESDIPATADRRAVLRDLLKAVPFPRLGRTTLSIALDPSVCHVRRVTGLPPAAKPAALLDVVRRNPRTFFALDAAADVVVHLVSCGSDVLWGIGVDAAIMGDIEAAAAASGLRADRLVPSIAILPLTVECDEVLWGQPPAPVLVRYGDGQLVDVRRFTQGAQPSQASAKPCLRSIDAYPHRFAAAYAVVVAPRDQRFAIPARLWRKATTPLWRGILAGVLLVAATAGAAGAPVVALRQQDRVAQQQQGELEAAATAARRARRSLRQVDDVLNAVHAFSWSRTPRLALLADLATLLPPRTALLMLQVDSAGGTLSALAADAALMVSALEQASAVSQLVIVGPVVPEQHGVDTLHRISMRFRINRPAYVASGHGGL